MHRLALFLVFVVPQLRITAPPELVPVQQKLEALQANGSKRFHDIAETVGLKGEGPPIEVVLAPETSEVARKMDPWVAGFASNGDVPGDRNEMVVLFPARTPSYPNSSLEDVLRHEVAHVLIGRASAGRPIPRWFNEGLAMSVERGWRLQDEGQLLYQIAVGSRTSLEVLDEMFSGRQTDVTRAYALSGALVHDLLQRHGSAVGAGILSRMNEGASFEHAFSEEVGMTPADAEAEFWMRQHTLAAWLPTLTSTTTLWFMVTALALLAIVRRVMKNRAIERKWVEEGVGQSREDEENVPSSDEDSDADS